MSKKKQLFFVSLVVLLLVCFLLCIFVFMAVKEMKINFLSQSNLNQEEIINTLNSKNVIPYGISTLFISRDKILMDIETNVPKLKVNNVEVEFPNVIKINCIERVALFYLEINQNTALILDKDLKVVSTTTISNALEKKYVKLNVLENLKFDVENWSLGSHIKIKYYEDCIKTFERIMNYYQQNSFAEIFCNHFNEVELRERYDIENSSHYSVLIFKTSSNKKITIKKPLINMDKRVGQLIALSGDSPIPKDEIEITY